MKMVVYILAAVCAIVVLLVCGMLIWMMYPIINEQVKMRKRVKKDVWDDFSNGGIR